MNRLGLSHYQPGLGKKVQAGGDEINAHIAPFLYCKAAPSRWVIPGWGWTAIAQDTLVLGRLSFLPISLGNRESFDRIGIYVFTPQPNALIRLGCYAWSNGQPGALIFDAGTVDASTSGVKALTIVQALPAGMYFLSGVCDTAEVVIRTADLATLSAMPVTPWCGQPGDAPKMESLAKTGQIAAVAGGLPDPAPTPSEYGSALVAVYLRLVD